MPKKEQTLYAFWPYDLFPYYLGATVTRFHGTRVETREYGARHLFTPVRVVEGDQGWELLEQLRELRNRRDKAQQALDKRFNAELAALGFKKPT